MVLLDDDLMLTDESDDEHVSICFINFANLSLNICKKYKICEERKAEYCLCAHYIL